MRYMFTSPRENTSGNPYLLPLPIAAQLVCFSVKYYLKRFYQEMNRFLDHKLSFILIYRVTFLPKLCQDRLDVQLECALRARNVSNLYVDILH